jgi:hypothetical protein
MRNLKYEIKFDENNIPYTDIDKGSLELEDKFAIIDLATSLVNASYVKKRDEIDQEIYNDHIDSLKKSIRFLNGLALNLGYMIVERDRSMKDLYDDLGINNGDDD